MWIGYAGARFGKAELAGLKGHLDEDGVEKKFMVEAATILKREIQSGLDYAAKIELAWVLSR